MSSLSGFEVIIPSPCLRWEFDVVTLGSGSASDCIKAATVAYSNALNSANAVASEICSSPFGCQQQLKQIQKVEVERCDPIGDEFEAVVRLSLRFGCA